LIWAETGAAKKCQKRKKPEKVKMRKIKTLKNEEN